MAKDNQQRERILDHLLDLLVEQGVAGLTVRKLALRSGVAIGTIQYYFPTKSQMVRAATQHALLRTKQAFQEQATDKMPPEQRLISFAHMLVPKGRGDRAAHVWLEVAALSAIDDEVAHEHSLFWQAIEGALADLIADISVLTARGVRPGDRAAQLLAFLDGLTIAVISEPNRMSSERAHACVDDWFKAYKLG